MVTGPGPLEEEARSDGQRQLAVLLVEDHRVFAEVLAARLRTEAGVRAVAVATSLGEARANLRRVDPDLVLLDLELNGENGLDLLGDVQRLPDPPHVLMLTGLAGASRVVQAFRAGAEGWVSKTASFETLLFAADEVVSGHMYLAAPDLEPVLRYLLDRTGEESTETNFVEGLTVRQIEVLRCVVAGMSRSECAEHLHLSVNTVRTHVQVLLKQADVHSTLALSTLARRLGVRAINEAAGSGERVP